MLTALRSWSDVQWVPGRHVPPGGGEPARLYWLLLYGRRHALYQHHMEQVHRMYTLLSLTSTFYVIAHLKIFGSTSTFILSPTWISLIIVHLKLFLGSTFIFLILSPTEFHELSSTYIYLMVPHQFLILSPTWFFLLSSTWKYLFVPHINFFYYHPPENISWVPHQLLILSPTWIYFIIVHLKIFVDSTSTSYIIVHLKFFYYRLPENICWLHINLLYYCQLEFLVLSPTWISYIIAHLNFF